MLQEINKKLDAKPGLSGTTLRWLKFHLKGVAGIESDNTAILISSPQPPEVAQVCWLLHLFCE